MTGRLADKRAVVTGAGRGLGRAIASALAGEGARVWVCDRNEEELGRTVDEIRSRGQQVDPELVDLREVDACLRFLDSVLLEGPVDCLVNNAAVLHRASIQELSLVEWSETLAVNLTAPFLFSRAVLPGMLERGGSIVNVSSRAGVRGCEHETAYCASKFGIEGLTRALTAELAGCPVSVNTVTPGLRIKPTSMTEHHFENLPEEERGRWSDPARLGPAFVALCSLTGEPSGRRWDALRLSAALEEEGFDMGTERLQELSE